MIATSLLLAALSSPPKPLGDSPAKPVHTKLQAKDLDRAEAYYHFSLGLQARFGGDADTALAEYRKAQKLDPTSGTIRLHTALLLRDAGKLDEAIGAGEEAVRLGPEEPDAHLTLAQLYQLKAEASSDEAMVKKAALEYEGYLKIRPMDGGVLQVLADVYGKLLQDHKAAVRVWQQYLQADPRSFDARIQIGTHYLALGDSDKAAVAFKEALELEPNSSRAYESLANVYARAQQTDQAIVHYRKALALEPTNLKYRLELGDVLFRAQRFKEALTESEAVLKSDTRNRFALDLKTRSLRELKDLDAASDTADRLLALDPRDPKAAYLRVTILEARKDYAGAAGALEAILAQPSQGDPEESGNNRRVFLVHLGYAYEQLQRPQDAAEVFAKAKLVGGEPDAALLGYEVEALLQAKSRDKALQAVRSARVRFPDDIELATLEATTLREQGNTQAALELLKGLEAKHPNDAQVLNELAEFYQRGRHYADAETTLRRALTVDPKSLRTLFQLGAVLEREKRRDEAETTFREALKVQPESAPVLNYLGYMNADRGVRLDEALSLIERAVALDSDNGAYEDSLGWALFRLDRIDQAEAHVRKALKTQATNAVVLSHLGDILKHRGHDQEAITYWKKALDGEDEDGDLDRAEVQNKIQQTQTALDALKKSP